MTSNWGKDFRITSFGESHGPCVGVVIDGCPAGLFLSEADLQPDLDRRKPGASIISSQRKEDDSAVILSGIHNGKTTGAPICILVWNKGQDSLPYRDTSLTPRPGHADYTNHIKFAGMSDHRGGGRSSGRVTIGLVMAGSIAKKLLHPLGISVFAHTLELGNIRSEITNHEQIKEHARCNSVYCADLVQVERMTQLIQEAREAGDSLGGVIEVIASGVPVGLGEPIFDTIEGELSKVFFSIPAIKGVEFGAGFLSSKLRGSQNNDPFVVYQGKVSCASNNAGGVLGGISNGMPIVARLAVKPTPSIAKTQQSVELSSLEAAEIRIAGRHDPCIVPRAVVVAENSMALVLCDFALRTGLIPRVIANVT